MLGSSNSGIYYLKYDYQEKKYADNASLSFSRESFSEFCPFPLAHNLKEDHGDIITSAALIGLIDQGIRLFFDGYGSFTENPADRFFGRIVRKPIGAHQDDITCLRSHGGNINFYFLT